MFADADHFEEVGGEEVGAFEGAGEGTAVADEVDGAFDFATDVEVAADTSGEIKALEEGEATEGEAGEGFEELAVEAGLEDGTCEGEAELDAVPDGFAGFAARPESEQNEDADEAEDEDGPPGFEEVGDGEDHLDAFWQAAADGLNHLGELGDQEGAEEDGDGEGGEEEEAGVDEGDADAGPDFAGAGEVGGLALHGFGQGATGFTCGGDGAEEFAEGGGSLTECVAEGVTFADEVADAAGGLAVGGDGFTTAFHEF